MPSRRSNLLFHWTGKSVGLVLETLDDVARSRYVDTMVSILTNGLWLSPCNENFRTNRGGHGLTPHVVCFTETRLSSATDHARKYGLLGIGFERDFVLRFHGAPVHYVRGRPQESLFEDLSELTRWFSIRMKNTDGAENDDAKTQFRRAYHLLAFMKPMSNLHAEHDDFELLHEHEWRIVQTDALICSLRTIRESKEDGKLLAVPVSREDVRLLVFPDDRTREMAGCDPRFQNYMAGLQVQPPMLTLQESREL